MGYHVGRLIDHEADELFLRPAGADPVSRVHLAFQTNGPAQVDDFHRVALAYYGAFALDPDGNNVEAVWHGPTRRSAPSIHVERERP